MTITPQHQPQFLTVTEVAQLFRLSYASIWRRVQEGVIPSVKIGTRVLIERAEAERMIAEGRRPIKQHQAKQATGDDPAPPAALA